MLIRNERAFFAPPGSNNDAHYNHVFEGLMASAPYLILPDTVATLIFASKLRRR